jgi:hypothetical protein
MSSTFSDVYHYVAYFSLGVLAKCQKKKVIRRNRYSHIGRTKEDTQPVELRWHANSVANIFDVSSRTVPKIDLLQTCDNHLELTWLYLNEGE